ncbi:MAG: long-chain fatty acid--CoA ligase [Desulfobacteraceae bacterium]
MTDSAWDTPFWPENVSKTTVPDYDYPVFEMLDRAAAKYPDKVFTIFNGAERTYARVKDTADRIAWFLAQKGIAKGDKVALILPNLPHYPEIFFGITKTGATCVTCNPIYTGPELHHQLADSEAKMVFCMDHPQFYENIRIAVRDTQVEDVIICNIKSYLPKLKGILGSILKKIPQADRHDAGHLFFDDIVASARPEPPKVDINPSEDTAAMLYTGGTTGVPKGAELVHTNFTYDVNAIYEYGVFVHEEGEKPEKQRTGGFHTYLGVLPWYHSFGITVAMLSAVCTGSRLVCIPDPRAGNPPFTEVLKAVEKYRPTLMPAVPTIFVAFTNHRDIDKYDLSSIMGCFSGGSPLPPDVCRQFEEKTGAVIFEGYGLTETTPVATANPTSKELRKIGSIGFPMPGTDIKIVDIETGLKEMPRGEEGEVAVCGPQVMKGYWQRPDANEEVFRRINGGRYFLTGDIGKIDEDGYIYITDRKKDMIIVGGFNVYPRDVEDILYTHPDVELAAVVGVPDPKSGEKVKAFLKLKPEAQVTEDEMKAFCKENMAGYKRPREIEFRDQLPVSAIGKLLRRELKKEHQ